MDYFKNSLKTYFPITSLKQYARVNFSHHVTLISVIALYLASVVPAVVLT